ncbi:MAG: N-formylglutamate amidohydrolase [Sphingomonadaceae bacterium]|nr:N-formylglutamate amidohydrolase [Sphingomonadaceae bacterium]
MRDSAVQVGGQIPGSDRPAFQLMRPEGLPIPVLVAAPHGGRSYPAELLSGMRRADYSCLRLEDRFVDQLAQQVARQTGATLLLAEAPRAMLDLNRAVEDVDWEMVRGGAPAGTRHSIANRRARSGLGLVPRRLAGLGEIWKHPLKREELEARIAGIHQPYHRALGQALEELRDRWGAALLVDLHSMPPLKRNYPGEQPAQFVIGDRFGASCDGMLVARAFRYFAAKERPAAHNRPYAGGYVLDRHAQPSRGIHAIQLEVCRATYLDRQFDQPSPDLPIMAGGIAGMVRILAGEIAEIGRDRNLPLAAE